MFKFDFLLFLKHKIISLILFSLCLSRIKSRYIYLCRCLSQICTEEAVFNNMCMS